MEPEIVDLCNFLSLIGVTFDGLGTSTLKVTGINPKDDINIEYSIIPDRIEAGTFMIACAATGGKINLINVDSNHLLAVINALQKTGSSFNLKDNAISMISDQKIKPVDITADIYPSFPTDLQAQWISLMIKSLGVSNITDTIYTDRFTHVPELIRLGANITMHDNSAAINGVKDLYAASVMSTDIRASASLIIGALISNGQTNISRIYHIDRGYENIENKLSKLGVDIIRINEE
jgi:UDP-N-acetylglucosamine 1-carboxyvinyltransferase